MQKLSSIGTFLFFKGNTMAWIKKHASAIFIAILAKLKLATSVTITAIPQIKTAKRTEINSIRLTWTELKPLIKIYIGAKTSNPPNTNCSELTPRSFKNGGPIGTRQNPIKI